MCTRILKMPLFLLSGNMAGIFCVLYATLAGLSMPFLPVHLLFINLVTDSLPALAIPHGAAGGEPVTAAARRGNEGIFKRQFSERFAGAGVLIAPLHHGGFYRMGMSSGGSGILSGTGILFENGGNFMRTPERVATTMAFTTLTLARLFPRV